jgi:hypothetical protein
MPPEHDPLTPPDAGPEVICLKCGHDLRGLPPSGACPECGMAIERSLQGNLLRFSDETYLVALHRGVFLILAAIIAQVVFYVALFVGAFALASGTVPPMRGIELFAAFAGCLLIGVVLVQRYGWWLFSAPDQAYLGADLGTTSRIVVRVTVAVLALLTGLNAAVESAQLGRGAGPMDDVADIVGTALLLALAVKFFASILYLRWLALRLPDPGVDRKAKLLMWLGPLLAIVGFMMCGLGPIVALVLFWLLLNEVRTDIKRIREQPAEPATG